MTLVAQATGRRARGRTARAAQTTVTRRQIEWEDDMVAINRETNATNMIWQLIDRDTGRQERRHLLALHRR